MNGPIKNMLVGIFILSAIALCVATILFLKPRVGDGKQLVYARFSDIGAINLGTRVLFAGKPVGEVVGLQEITNAREEPTDQLGRVYFYQLTLQIDSNIKVYNTDEVTIQTSGLLGEKSIAIIPKSPPKGVHPKLIKGEPIYADSVDPLQSALVDFADLSASMEEAFGQVSIWIKNHGEELASTVLSAKGAMDQIEKAVGSFNTLHIADKIEEGLTTFNATITQVHKAMEELEEKQAFSNLADAIAHVKSAATSIDLVTDKIAHGEGTVGKLLMDDDLYLQLSGIMSKANTLMNDINHYGILFHLNKQWQRQRLQRITLLNALNSPHCFQTYFQTEVNEINIAMSRIALLIDKAEQTPEKEQILNSPQFKQGFNELLHRADELSENLRLYNQQITEALSH